MDTHLFKQCSAPMLWLLHLKNLVNHCCCVLLCIYFCRSSKIYEYISYLPLLVPAKEEDRYNQTGKSDDIEPEEQQGPKRSWRRILRRSVFYAYFFFRLRSSCLQLLRGRRKVGNNLDIFGLEVKLHSF